MNMKVHYYELSFTHQCEIIVLMLILVHKDARIYHYFKVFEDNGL